LKCGGATQFHPLSLHVDLPGVDPKTVEITTDQGVLTIRGSREELRNANAIAAWNVTPENFSAASACAKPRMHKTSRPSQ
jgi:hypothetical protein